MQKDLLNVWAQGDVHPLLSPGLRSRFFAQLFTHSAHAPLTILILEWLLSGAGYFLTIDPYLLMVAALLQSAFLARLQENQWLKIFLSNLLGASFYSLFEYAMDGRTFLDQGQHLAYWSVSLTFAVIQALHAALKSERAKQGALLLESICRAGIPVVLYAVFEAKSKHATLDLPEFWADPAHIYLTIVILMLGVLLGFADLAWHRAMASLRCMATQLHQLSSWSLGANVVAAAIHDVSQISLKRQVRSLLFMDVRGFTRWSEQQSPESVVSMLNEYYQRSEQALAGHAPIKLKFTADEVMAVFADHQDVLKAAMELQQEVCLLLERYGLQVGLAIHSGSVVEGLLGSTSVKAFDVIGDTVNTAARLCAAAGPGELLVSAELDSQGRLASMCKRSVSAKGKAAPIEVYVVPARG
jgi:adenylate cyclase